MLIRRLIVAVGGLLRLLRGRRDVVVAGVVVAGVVVVGVDGEGGLRGSALDVLADQQEDRAAVDPDDVLQRHRIRERAVVDDVEPRLSADVVAADGAHEVALGGVAVAHDAVGEDRSEDLASHPHAEVDAVARRHHRPLCGGRADEDLRRVEGRGVVFRLHRDRVPEGEERVGGLGQERLQEPSHGCERLGGVEHHAVFADAQHELAEEVAAGARSFGGAAVAARFEEQGLHDVDAERRCRVLVETANDVLGDVRVRKREEFAEELDGRVGAAVVAQRVVEAGRGREAATALVCPLARAEAYEEGFFLDVVGVRGAAVVVELDLVVGALLWRTGERVAGRPRHVGRHERFRRRGRDDVASRLGGRAGERGGEAHVVSPAGRFEPPDFEDARVGDRGCLATVLERAWLRESEAVRVEPLARLVGVVDVLCLCRREYGLGRDEVGVAVVVAAVAAVVVVVVVAVAVAVAVAAGVVDVVVVRGDGTILVARGRLAALLDRGEGEAGTGLLGAVRQVVEEDRGRASHHRELEVRSAFGEGDAEEDGAAIGDGAGDEVHDVVAFGVVAAERGDGRREELDAHVLEALAGELVLVDLGELLDVEHALERRFRALADAGAREWREAHEVEAQQALRRLDEDVARPLEAAWRD